MTMEARFPITLLSFLFHYPAICLRLIPDNYCNSLAICSWTKLIRKIVVMDEITLPHIQVPKYVLYHQFLPFAADGTSKQSSNFLFPKDAFKTNAWLDHSCNEENVRGYYFALQHAILPFIYF